jgi:hypothetical protein
LRETLIAQPVEIRILWAFQEAGLGSGICVREGGEVAGRNTSLSIAIAEVAFEALDEAELQCEFLVLAGGTGSSAGKVIKDGVFV